MNNVIKVDTSSMASALDKVRDGVSHTADAVQTTTNAVRQAAKEVKGTTNAVGETRYAVKEMMASVVAAEAEAAQRVSRNVSTGFLGLISSQLMQKKIEAQTVMQSKCQVLGHYNRQLHRLQTQLEGDYQRITKRYAKIINQLNENLKSRIYQLDAPAAEVSDEGYKSLEKRVLVSGAPIPLFEQDILALSNQVCVIRCKDSCARALPEVKNFVIQLKKLKRAMDASVRDVAIAATGRLSMPVIVIEAEDTNVKGQKKLDVVFGERKEQKTQSKRIRANFDEVQSRLSWRTSGSSRDVVVKKIEELASKNGLGERTRAAVMKLAGESFWQEMEART